MRDKTAYWLDLCDDDVLTAKALLKSERLLPMGFFCHMITEKALKAVIAERTDEVPPRIHDLAKLANRAGIWESVSDEQKELFKKLTPLQIEARYPEYKERVAATLTKGFCKQLFSETEVFLCWIKAQLER
ncbi:MAG: HEPN domain-containing protein [Coriobacteriales bacterium]|nr:HEPN domain-containing protein [Coriobacteriales bacterium]